MHVGTDSMKMSVCSTVGQAVFLALIGVKHRISPSMHFTQTVHYHTRICIPDHKHMKSCLCL